MDNLAELLPGTLDLLILKANRRAKFYQLTAAGRKRLRFETAGWNLLAAAMTSVLNTSRKEI